MKTITTTIATGLLAIATLLGGSRDTSAQTLTTNNYSQSPIVATGTLTGYGTYYGYVRYTNSIGSVWLTDAPHSYEAMFDNLSTETNKFAIQAVKKTDGSSAYGTNYVDVATTNTSEAIIIYFLNKPVNTNTPVPLQAVYVAP